MDTSRNEPQQAGSKAGMRSLLTTSRDAVSAELRSERSEAACRHAAGLLEQRAADSMLVYVPFRSELDTWPLIRWAWDSGVSVVAPRSRKEDRFLELYRITGPEDLQKGAYGIMEPDPETAEPYDDVPDIIWVPGLAFDRRGGRLGYGGGYYDRLQERLAAGKQDGPKPLWIGLGYELQILVQVPADSHDLRLDGLVTESGIFMFA